MASLIPQLILVAFALILVIAVVLNGSGRRRYSLTFKFSVHAKADQVWKTFIGAHGPGSWRPEVVSIAHREDDPALIEQVCVHKGHSISILIRILECVPGVSMISRCERIADQDTPLGLSSFCAVKFQDKGDRTRVVYREEGEFDRPWDFLLFWLSQRAALMRLKANCERTAMAAIGQPIAVPGRFLIAGSTLIMALIISAAGWTLGLLVFALVSVMEYGHARTIQRSGDRPSISVLLPFVGGAMAMSRRRKTVFGEAVSALSGPIALAYLVVALGFASIIAGEGELGSRLQDMSGMGAVILTLFLLPVYPLNGGWIIGVLRPHLPRLAVVLPAVTAAVFVSIWGLMTQSPILSAFGALLAIQMLSQPRVHLVASGILSTRHALLVTSAYAAMILLASVTVQQWLIT